MNTNETLEPNRLYKDKVFRMLFSKKEHLLELYNALNGTKYGNPEELEIMTWDDVLYMRMKNDVSMLIDGRLNLYEHQSSWNPNMPLRGLIYFAELYKDLTREKNIYGPKLIPLPTPIYIVFYNGERKMGDFEEMKLSDAFVYGNEQSGMELKVKVINIKYGMNRELMEKCRTLADYAFFVGQVKTYLKQMELKAAIHKAIEDCVQEDRLAEFLKSRRDEVMCSLLTEYDEEKTLAMMREEMKEIAKEELRDSVVEELRKEVKKEVKEEIRKEIKEEVRQEVRKEAFEDGVEDGMRKGVLTGGISTLIQDNIEDGKSREQILTKLMKRFGLTGREAEMYYDQYTK